MKSLLKKAIDVRSGEFKPVAIMAGYVFVIIASYNVLKPMTRSLFVTQVGLEQLPFLYMMLAVAVGAFVFVYLKISSLLSPPRLIAGTTITLMASLLLFWWSLQLGVASSALYYSLFIWASIYGVLTTSQFWLLANYMFNSRAAKRLFPILTASGLAGAIMGGYFTRFLVRFVGGTPNLAFFCLGLLAIALVLGAVAWKNRDKSLAGRQATRTGQTSSTSLRSVFQKGEYRGHLGSMLGIVCLTYMVVQIADFQFVAFASESMSDVDDLTGFLGLWLSNLSIFALAFQLLFANSILQRFGVGVTILFLPIALLMTSVWVFFSFGLISILSLKVGDGAFRHSINKVGVELLYLPIPADVKKKTKAFIDMFVDRFARGLAGLLLLIVFSVLKFEVNQISILVVGLVVIWLWLARVANREYVNSFREAIAQRKIDLDAVSFSITDRSTIDSLLGSLASSNGRQVAYALQVLQSVGGIELSSTLLELLIHDNSEVRLRALQLLRQQNLRPALVKVKPLLSDPDESVRREAVRAVCELSDEAPEILLRRWLDDDDPRLKGAALHFLAENGDLAKKLLTPEAVKALVQGNADERVQIAGALGVLNDKNYSVHLHELLQDPEERVRSNALESAGMSGDKQFVPSMLPFLDDRTFGKVARQALARLGESVTPELSQALQNQQHSMALRVNLTRVLSLIGSQKSVEALLQALRSGQGGAIRYQTIKALNKLRQNFPELKFDSRFDDAVADALSQYFRTLTVRHIFDGDLQNRSTRKDEPAGCLLLQALQERLDDQLELIFRLLGLRYSPKDIYNAYAARKSENLSMRADAVELLDNILSVKHKRALLPVVEGLPVEQVLKLANGHTDSGIQTRSDAIHHLLDSEDSLLRACALFFVYSSGDGPLFAKDAERALASENRLVRETAEFVLKHLP